MDYKQEMFYRTPDQNMTKMPFYMAYPMQTVFLEEMEKLKDLYPREVRAIQEMVEDECDKMEYDGSLMFDEYPDRLMLNQVVKRIYDGVAVSGQDMEDFEANPYGTDRYETGQYEAEQYETKQYEVQQYEEDDMQAEELPLEGNLVAQRGQRRPGRPQDPWGPGRPPGGGWGPGRPSRPGRPPRGRDDGLNDLIEVLLFNEMHRRRCRHRRCRRWW